MEVAQAVDLIATKIKKRALKVDQAQVMGVDLARVRAMIVDLEVAQDQITIVDQVVVQALMMIVVPAAQDQMTTKADLVVEVILKKRKSKILNFNLLNSKA